MFIARRSFGTDYTRQSADYYRLRGDTAAIDAIAEALDKSMFEYNKGPAVAIELMAVAGPQCLTYETTVRIDPEDYTVFMANADVADLGGESLLDIYFGYYSNTRRSSPDAFMEMMVGYACICGMKIGCRSCRYITVHPTRRDGTEQDCKSDTTFNVVCGDPYNLYEGTSNVYLAAASVHAIGVHGYYASEKEARDALVAANAGLTAEEIDATLAKCLAPVTPITLYNHDR